MQAIILAAGESSRFWSLNSQHKSLIKIMGKPLILHTIEALKRSGIKDIVVIQGPKKEIEKELEIYKLKIKYTIQPKPKGSGDALLCVNKFINGNFLVIGPHKIDLDDYLPAILRKSKKNPKKIILTGVETKFPGDYGVLNFKGDKIIEIIENPKKGKEPSNIKSSEIYVFPKDFFNYLKKIPEKEDNLIDAINILIKERGAELFLFKEETSSLKYPWRLFDVSKYLFNKRKAIIKGKVEAGCKISGKVFVDTGTILKSGTYIEGPVYIGKNCEIGPNCYIRSFADIGDNCKIGNGVEIKNSIIGDNSKIPHLSYIGDSIVGRNCNLGAGTTTANLRFNKDTVKVRIKGNLIDSDRKKFGCVVGNNTQTGINVSIMPGVLIGSNCNIGPHSVVFGNIEDNTNFYTEFKGIKIKK